MSNTVVTDLAEKYGIEVRWVPQSAIPRRFQGTVGQGCNPKKRLLYFENDGLVEGQIEHYFHELVHVIVQAPWRSWAIEKMPEEVLLFQFERALANAVMEDWAYDRVCTWQHETGIAISGRYPGAISLGDLPSYTKEPFWEYGYALCRRLGILNAKNHPTYRWPEWDRIAPLKNAILRHFHTRGRTPLPPLL